VRIVLANQGFADFGGSETYLLTIAHQLTRLGHEPIIHGRQLGEMAELARGQGIPVVTERQLPDGCDAVLSQDGTTAYELAARYPETTHVFVAHSPVYDLQTPPQLDGVVSAVVALNDRVEFRMRAMALRTQVVRLHQPVDLRRFAPRGDIRETPRRALLFGNRLMGRRYEMVASACSALEIECERAGHHGTTNSDPERSIADADIVIGNGRSILEAMSCGRAAFAYDHRGGHGWVTPESYPTLEADGFTGFESAPIVDRDALRDALAGYTSEMGLVNRELVQANHGAHRHAQELVALMRELSPRSEPPAAPLREMSRLVQLAWQHEAWSSLREDEAWELRQRVEQLEGENRQLHTRLEALLGSWRYRLGSMLAWPRDAWRRIRGSYSHEA
jgi:hypothetical protein